MTPAIKPKSSAYQYVVRKRQILKGTEAIEEVDKSIPFGFWGNNENNKLGVKLESMIDKLVC